MKPWLAPVVALAACGDNLEPVLYPAHDLVVVAHQDDDLLFLQPDLFELVSHGEPLTVVYVTAGDAGLGLDYVAARKNAARIAYGTVAGSQDWLCTAIQIADHAAEHCRLAMHDLSLVFLDYPDGGVSGELPGSLLKLWEGSIDHVATIAAKPATYDRDALIATVASVIDQTRPTVLRTLEVAGTHGDDHSDHMMVGALVQVALASTTSDAQLVAYRGYNVNSEPANLDDATFQQASLFMRMYLACMTGCGTCGQSACPTVDDARYYNFLHRSYPVETTADVTSVVSSPVGCLGHDDTDEITLVACDDAPEVRLDEGLLHIGDGCVEVRKSGRLVVGDCDHEPERHFDLDDEGHIWAGVVAPAGPNALYNHTACVYAEAGTIKAGACGEDRDWRWQLAP